METKGITREKRFRPEVYGESERERERNEKKRKK